MQTEPVLQLFGLRTLGISAFFLEIAYATVFSCYVLCFILNNVHTFRFRCRDGVGLCAKMCVKCAHKVINVQYTKYHVHQNHPVLLTLLYLHTCLSFSCLKDANSGFLNSFIYTPWLPTYLSFIFAFRNSLNDCVWDI